MSKLVFRPDPAKLRAARIAANIDQTDLAAEMGVGKSQVSNIEAGVSRIRSEHLATWCRLCGIPNPFDLYSHLPPIGEVERPALV